MNEETIKPLWNGKADLLTQTAAGEAGKKRECRLQLENEVLTILPSDGGAIILALDEIAAIRSGDYQVNIENAMPPAVTLSGLGYQYEDFMRIFTRRWNEIQIRGLLWSEEVQQKDIAAEFTYIASAGASPLSGSCLVRLYQTALILVPEQAPFIRIFYGDIAAMEKKEWRLTIEADGCRLTLEKMGGYLDPTEKTLAESLSDLELQTQSFWRGRLDRHMPADAEVIARAAQLLREGKTVLRSRLDALSPRFWPAIEKYIAASEMHEYYEFLQESSDGTEMAVGWKRGLMGSLTGDYLWLFVPLKNPRRADAPLLALETLRIDPESDGESAPAEAKPESIPEGRATYFFLPAGQGVGPAIESLGRTLRDINFRREPIFLPEDKLLNPVHRKYRLALQRLPAVAALRRCFVGRAVHSSFPGWRAEVERVLTGGASCAKI